MMMTDRTSPAKWSFAYLVASICLFIAGSAHAADQNGQAARDYERGWTLVEARQIEKGKVLLEKAAEAGHVEAQHKLGALHLSLKNDIDAARWYKVAAENGHANAQFMLAGLYGAGRGVTQNNDSALKWFESAADQGHARAQFMVGVHYLIGEGVPKDERKGASLIRQAAKKGALEAQFHLGGMYENGQGVEKNLEAAIRWYHLASKRGHAGAQNRLAWVMATSSDAKIRNPFMAFNFALVSVANNDVAEARNTLAATHAAAGRFEEAIREQEQAIEKAKKRKLDLTFFEKRLQLYRAGKSFTCPSEYCEPSQGKE